MPAAAHPTPALVLAALERAVLHRGDGRDAVPVRELLAHLHVRQRSGAARRVRELLHELCAAGAVRRQRRHSVAVFALTPAGTAALGRARARWPVTLPESPQHRAWRRARAVAAFEIERLRAELAAGLDDAAALLGAEPAPRSEQWFSLAERLRHGAWVLGSASHCLYEWEEPSDARADVDVGPAGRRNVRLWTRPEPERGSP